MKFASFLLLLSFLFFQISVKSQEDWDLSKDKDGIKVFTRKTQNFKFRELKVECEFDGRISQLAAVLLDVSNHYKWVYKTTKSELLKTISATDLLFYTEVECPWPFENRDLVVHMNLIQDPQNKVMTVEAENVNNYLPDKDNIIRMKYSRVTWTVTPLNSKQFKIDYRIQIDPGGSVPAWILNLFASKGPYESFMNLKEEIKLPQYEHAKFSFILD